jgi:hypothetical protein
VPALASYREMTLGITVPVLRSEDGSPCAEDCIDGGAFVEVLRNGCPCVEVCTDDGPLCWVCRSLCWV